MIENAYLFFFSIIIALIIDLITHAFANPYIPQLLLIFFMHTLYDNQANYQKYSLLFCLEIISFLQFGKVGLSALMLIPLMLQFQYIKDYVFLKLLAPCLYIFIYSCYGQWCTAYHFGHTYNFAYPIIQTIVNCCCFLLLEKFYKQE